MFHYLRRFAYIRFIFLLLCGLPLSTEAKQPQGWYYQLFVDRSLWQEHRIDIYGRVQVGAMYNDNGSDNVFPSGFFNADEGLVFNRAEWIIEKPLRTSYKPRIGPVLGPAPDSWDWGFLVQGRYGEDLSQTYGFDDEMGINDGESQVFSLPQWFVKAYAPWGGGATFQFGTWFTNIGNEINAPIDPPNPFYSHPYAMLYGPSKHFGGLLSTRLPIEQGYGIWGIELGLVQGWNNLQDNNDEKSLITALQWRSPDMRTRVDLESIWGNEQSEGEVFDQRPFVVVSANDENLFRQFHSMTLTQWLGREKNWRFVLNTVYGNQEGGDVGAKSGNPPGFTITENSQWYGWNGSVLWQIKKDLQLGLRAEWFTDKDGAYFLLPEGRYNAWTMSIAWYPEPWLRIRPEIRFDRYSGSGKPFGGELPAVFSGTKQEQTLFSIDATLFL